MESEVRALRDAGHEVQLFAQRTDELAEHLLYPLISGLRVATGRGQSPLQVINSFQPDVVHIHNLFPNMGRRWVEKLDFPVVHTLHNYRPLCANGLLYRDGEICTECPDGKSWAGVQHACYRNSRLATFPIAWANRKGPSGDPLINRADKLIVLSERQRYMYKMAGVPESKMIVWPNFIPDSLVPRRVDSHERYGWLFVGRITAEKGVLRLIERWPGTHLLRVVGDGDQRPEVEAVARGRSIEVLGSLERTGVIGLMGKSQGLVFPSEWFEAFPLVYLEALSMGLPVLAFEPNSVAEFVRRDRTGWIVSDEMDMTVCLERASQEAVTMRDHCRRVFNEIGTEASYRERAVALYQDVASER